MRRVHFISILTLSSIALLTAAITSFSGPASPHVQSVKTPEAVAETLDRLIQPRFQVEAGLFGVARIGIPGHNAILDRNMQTDFEKQLELKVNEANRSYTVGVFHCVAKPGRLKTPSNMAAKWEYKQNLNPRYEMFYIVKQKTSSNGGDRIPDRRSTDWDSQNRANVQALCLKAMPKLKQGQSVNATMGKWLVAMRPIRALKSSCVSCHAGAHTGDTLGVMVYTVQ